MILYQLIYDGWHPNVSIFSTLEKAKKDIINYIKSDMEGECCDWELEKVREAFEETAEIFGFSDWEEGFLKCPYNKINNYLGDFARIKAITLDKSIWKD